MMWTEGALGVALAHPRFGNKAIGEEVIREVLKYRSRSGGIHYVSLPIAHEFPGVPAVARTGWLVIILGFMENNNIANLSGIEYLAESREKGTYGVYAIKLEG